MKVEQGQFKCFIYFWSSKNYFIFILLSETSRIFNFHNQTLHNKKHHIIEIRVTTTSERLAGKQREKKQQNGERVLHVR